MAGKKLYSLTYDNPPGAPRARERASGLKKNKKKMMLVPSLRSKSALSFSGIVTDFAAGTSFIAAG
jgi:hypothetical protein